MISQCNQCGSSVGTAGAPVLGCLVMLASGFTGLLFGPLARLSPWTWLAAPVVWFFILWGLWEGPRGLAMLRNRFRRCPTCGKRDWGRPRYGGFS